MRTFDKNVSADKDLGQWATKIDLNRAGKGLAIYWAVIGLIHKGKAHTHIHSVPINTTYLGNILRFSAAFLR